MGVLGVVWLVLCVGVPLECVRMRMGGCAAQLAPGTGVCGARCVGGAGYSH